MMKILAGSSVREELKMGGASLLDKGIPFGFDFDAAIASRVNILEEALHFSFADSERISARIQPGGDGRVVRRKQLPDRPAREDHNDSAYF